MITNFLLIALINAIAILGLHAFLNGESWLSKRLTGLIPAPIKNPVYDCEVCMASIWGTIGFFAFYHVFLSVDAFELYEWAVIGVSHVLTVAGINTIYLTWQIKDLIDDIANKQD